jgi:hypothetical protein
MPTVLVIVFAIALVFTVIGLLLSYREAPRSPQIRYPAAANVVESTLVVERLPQTTTEISAGTNIMRRRVSIEDEDMRTELLKLRASTRAIRANTAPVRRAGARTSGMKIAPAGGRAAPRVSSAGLVYPNPLEDLKERLHSWKAGVGGVIAIFLLGFYLLGATLSHSLLWTTITFSQAGPPPPPPAPSNNSPVYTASQHLIRLGQLDPGQYRSMQEFNTWAYSACSAASMTEVINSYGHSYRITDILKVESGLNEITPQLGLLHDAGIQRTGAQFGFKTNWGYNRTLQQVIDAANSGTPVIVSFPPYKFAGGHILVVRGGDSNFVYLADSSRLNWTQLSHDRFMQLWGGFSAIMTPA